MKKILILLAMILCAVGISHASDVYFNYTLVFNDTFYPMQDTKIGTIIFNPIVINPQTVIASDNGAGYSFSGSLKKGDIIRLSDTASSMVIDGNFVQAGQSYTITEQKVYTYYRASNPSTTFQLTILPFTDQHIYVYEKNQPANYIYFDHPDFILSPNAETNIMVYSKMPINTIPQNYDLKFNFVSSRVGYNDSSVFFTKSIQVLNYAEWNINFTQNNNTVAVGDSIKLATLKFLSNGNSVKNLNINITGDLQNIVKYQPTVSMYVGVETELDISSDISSLTELREYKGVVNVYDTQLKRYQYFNMSVYVIDNQVPKINSIIVKENYTSGDEVIIYADVSDNSQIGNVTFSLDRNYNGVMTTPIQNVLMNRESTSKFSRKNIFIRDIGNYTLTIKAYDLYDNTNESVENFIVNPIQTVFVTDNLNFNKTQVNKWIDSGMLSIKTDTPVNLSLSDISCGKENITQTNGNQTYVNQVARACEKYVQFAVIFPNGDKKLFDMTGKSIIINKAGSYQFSFKSTIEDEIRTTVNVKTPANVLPVDNIDMRTLTVGYFVPKPFTVSWVGSGQLHCDVLDTGSIDTSVYNCKTTLPITTDAEKLSFPMTKEFYDKDKNDAQLRLEKEKARNYYFISVIIIGTLVVLALIFICTVQIKTIPKAYLYKNLSYFRKKDFVKSVR